MFKLVIVCLAILTSGAALAQQQPQPKTPAEIALQINGVVGTWAQTLVEQGKMIEELQKQLAAGKAKCMDDRKKD